MKILLQIGMTFACAPAWIFNFFEVESKQALALTPALSPRTVSVYRSGGRPACRRAGHPARRILVWASPSIARSELPFRAARCRPLRQPGSLPLQPQADAKQLPIERAGVSVTQNPRLLLHGFLA